MNTVKVSKYSRQLPELYTHLNLLKLGQSLVYQSARCRRSHSLSESILELIRFEQRIEAVTDEIRSTELLHEAALLIGDYWEYPTLDVV